MEYKEIELSCAICKERKYPVYVVGKERKIKIAIKCKCGLAVNE